MKIKLYFAAVCAALSCLMFSGCDDKPVVSQAATMPTTPDVLHDQAYYKAHLPEAKARMDECHKQQAAGVTWDEPHRTDCLTAEQVWQLQPYVPDNSKPAFHG